jgi:hypothetical protein
MEMRAAWISEKWLIINANSKAHHVVVEWTCPPRCSLCTRKKISVDSFVFLLLLNYRACASEAADRTKTPSDHMGSITVGFHYENYNIV